LRRGSIAGFNALVNSFTKKQHKILAESLRISEIHWLAKPVNGKATTLFKKGLMK
jgi:hypothetical protein